MASEKSRQKGRFIVFEGIDGSGKSTQAAYFAETLFLSDKRNTVVLTREPYDPENIREIRQRLRQETDARANAEKMAELYIADRKKHVAELISPQLAAGVHVVSDRYELSTIAYQSAQGLDIEDLFLRHQELPVPDLTFFIDVPVEVAFQRTDRQEGKFEQLEFQKELREKYFRAIKRAEQKGQKIIIIDAKNFPPKKVAMKVRQEYAFSFPFICGD